MTSVSNYIIDFKNAIKISSPIPLQICFLLDLPQYPQCTDKKSFGLQSFGYLGKLLIDELIRNK